MPYIEKIQYPNELFLLKLKIENIFPFYISI